MPAFPPGCSPNLSALTLFTTDVIFPEIITLAPPAGPVITCDDFNRPFNLSLGANWFESNEANAFNDPILVWLDQTLALQTSEFSPIPFRNIRGTAWWSANSFNDTQSSEATLTALPTLRISAPAPDNLLISHIGGLGVRLSGIWSNFTGYVAVLVRELDDDPLSFRVYRAVNCSTANNLSCWVQVGSDITPVPSVGDVITLAVSALDIVTVRVNTILVFTNSDITLDPKPTSGNPGFICATTNVDQGVQRTNWDLWCGTGGIA